MYAHHGHSYLTRHANFSRYNEGYIFSWRRNKRLNADNSEKRRKILRLYTEGPLIDVLVTLQ